MSFLSEWRWLPCTSRSFCNSLTIPFRAHQAPQRFGPRGQEPYTWLVIKPETECCPNNISSSAQFINFINLKIHCHFFWWKASMLREALWLAKHREGWTTSPCFPPYHSPRTVREGGLLKSGKKKAGSPVEDQEIHCWVGSPASFRPRLEKIFATNPFWYKVGLLIACSCLSI